MVTHSEILLLERIYTLSKLCFFIAVAFPFLSSGLNAQTSLPDDVYKNDCDVDIATGVVKAPNNAAPHALKTPCDFYRQAEKMFIWLTSSPPADYGGGRYVFTSPAFYAVSPPVNGYRRLIINPGAVVPDLFDVTISQTGPRGSAVVFDTSGKLHELIYPKWLQIRQPQGLRFVDIANRKVINYKSSKLFDSSFARIIPSRRTIVANGARYHTNLKGDVIDYGSEHTDHNVRMAQNGKLLYYGIWVNDVYAAFKAGYTASQAPSEFPVTKDGFENLPDADALVIELKTAWIEIGEQDVDEYKNNYLIVDAMIPRYKIVSKNMWERTTPDKPATLALVGMRIVFSAKDQPGMIWATFEHISNSRNMWYEYWTKDGLKWKRWCADPDGGKWLFSNDDKGPFNEARMHVDQASGDILGEKGIGPSNIRRAKPWGADGGMRNDNTNSININKSVIGQLSKAVDVRKNYIMIGTAWQNQGAHKLANSTMETFQQDSNCLGCHTGSSVSQIWGKLMPRDP
jgi:hypothetical protein